MGQIIVRNLDDAVIARLMDVIAAFPFLLFAIAASVAPMLPISWNFGNILCRASITSCVIGSPPSIPARITLPAKLSGSAS